MHNDEIVPFMGAHVVGPESNVRHRADRNGDGFAEASRTALQDTDLSCVCTLHGHIAPAVAVEVPSRQPVHVRARSRLEGRAWGWPEPCVAVVEQHADLRRLMVRDI